MDHHRRTRGKWLSGSALLCLALAACNKAPPETAPVTGAPIAAMELATTAPPPATYAPPAAALPPAPRAVAYRPSPQHWRYLTDAYDMSDAFADTPPDYTVAYDGEDPYVWRADDGAYRVVEWLPDGARYYYYEPGADEPFLIQDPEYNYAYDNGVLVAVYTLAGALVADRIAAEREGYAARYYARGHDLYRAAVNDRRRPAYAANWQQRAPSIQAQRDRWQRGREAEPGWRDWNRAHQAQQDARWAPERQHRAAYAQALRAQPTTTRHDQAQPPRTAEAGRPTPRAHGDRGPGPFPGANQSNSSERRDQTQQRPGADRAAQHQPQPGDQADRHRPNRADNRPDARPQLPRPQFSSQPQTVPQARVADRQAIAHAEQAQHQQAQHAEQAKHQQAQQTEQAQHQAMQQARHAEVQARQQQHQQARAEAKPTPHVETPHVQPPHTEVPHPAPAPHAQQSQAQAPHPAQQQHGHDKGNNNGNGQKDDRHHH